MKRFILLMILSLISTSAFAAVSLEKTASDLVKNLFGREGDHVVTLESNKQGVYRVSLTNNATVGSAIYRVEFHMINLQGAEEEETVSDIKVIYESGN